MKRAKNIFKRLFGVLLSSLLLTSFACAQTETEVKEAYGIVADYSAKKETQKNAVISAEKGTYLSDHESTSSVSWLEEYSGAEGVAKIVADNANQDGAGYINVKLPPYKAKEMIENDFAYLTLRLRVEVDARLKQRLNAYYGGEFRYLTNSAYGKAQKTLSVGKWTTLTIGRNEFTQGDDTALEKALTEEGVTLYTDQVRWVKGGSLGYEYAYVLKDTAGDYRIIDKNTGWQAATITCYVDEIKWHKDDGKPELTMISSGTTVIGQAYEPRFSVTDTYDVAPTLETVTVTKENETEPLPLTDGKLTFTEAGQYTVTATAKDKAGNVTEKSFPLTVLAEADKYLINDYGSAESLETFHEYVSIYEADERYYDEPSIGKVEWLYEYKGANGVSKVTVDNAAENGTGFFGITLTDEQIDLIIAEEFDYISVRILVAVDESVEADFEGETVGIYGAFAGNTVPIGEWTTITARSTAYRGANGTEATIRSRLSRGQPVSYLNSLRWCSTKDGANEKYDHLVLFAQINNENFHVKGKEAGHRASIVTYYVDEIRWGVDE